MLKTRVITAILALIPFLWVFVKGDAITISLFFGVLVGISAFEMGSMIFKGLYQRLPESPEPPLWLTLLTVILSVSVYLGLSFLADPNPGYLGLLLLGSILVGIFAGKSPEQSVSHAVGLTTGIVYSVFPWIAILALYRIAGDSRFIFPLRHSLVWRHGSLFLRKKLG